MKKVKKVKEMKKRDNEKIFSPWMWILIGGVIVVSIINIFVISTNNDIIDLDIETRAVQKIRENYQPDREAYGYIGDNEENPTVKSYIERDIPFLPSYFWKVKYSFLNNNPDPDLCNVDEVFYRQPEWIGDVDSQYEYMSPFITAYVNHLREGISQDHAYLLGIGGYPAIHRIETERGEEFEICTYLYTSPKVESYQGVKIVTVDSNRIIWDDSYNDVYRLNDGDYTVDVVEPDKLFEPTFPRLSYEWIKLVKMKVKISEDAVPGTYVFRIELASPDKELDAVWLEENSPLYFDGSVSQAKADKPRFQAIMEVG